MVNRLCFDILVDNASCVIGFDLTRRLLRVVLEEVMDRCADTLIPCVD